MKTLALCMIVKDEARILRRCLVAARPLIDFALIVDTGSSDATLTELHALLLELGLDGMVVEEAWRDFAHNRSSALAKLRRRSDIDYALMIDADDCLVLGDGFDASAFKASLAADVVNVWTRLGGYSYTRPQLISNRKPFCFRGVVHEFLDCAEGFTQETTASLCCESMQDGARNRAADKYRRDATVLVAALEGEADPFLRARYTFYLAQSLRDCGDHRGALEAYLGRAELGYWEEEVYLSLYYAGQMAEALGHDASLVIDAYLRAYEVRPRRAEALHAAARCCRVNGRHQSGYLFASRGLEIARA